MDFTNLLETMNLSGVEINPLLRSYEREWVMNTSRTIEEEIEKDEEVRPVCILTIPKTLISAKQEAYVPQVVAIGPYHQKRLDLYDMVRYKIASAKRTQRLLKTQRFRDVVERFSELEEVTRACYHKFLDYGSETLAWIMAIDACFLVEYMQVCTAVKGLPSKKVSSCMLHLIDYNGRKFGHQAILRDIIMLENQIPLFLLRELFGFLQDENPNKFFAETLKGICQLLSPIKSMDFFPSCEEVLLQRTHLLELLYFSLVSSKIEEGDFVKIGIQQGKVDEEDDQNRLWSRAKGCLSQMLPCFKKAVTSNKFTLLVKFPLKIAKKIWPGQVQKALEELVESAEEVAMVAEKEENTITMAQAEEIAIPSVSELSSAGIRFRPTKGGLGSIKFDKTNATFALPTIVLDEKSEVVLRNLIAYESLTAPDSMVFIRYAELMNGIIDTKEDVAILRDAGVIVNFLNSDSEAVEMWNGMTKSVKRSEVTFLDDTIRSINHYYSSRWKVKASTFIKKHVFNPWRFILFFVTNIFLLLAVLQAFCSIHNCKRTIVAM